MDEGLGDSLIDNCAVLEMALSDLDSAKLLKFTDLLSEHGIFEL